MSFSYNSECCSFLDFAGNHCLDFSLRLAQVVDEIVVSYVQWREVLTTGRSFSALGKSDTQLLN